MRDWLEMRFKICKYSRRKMAAGFGKQKGGKKRRDRQKPQISGEILLQNAISCHIQGDLENAEKAYRVAIDSGLINIALFLNLGIICQTSQRAEEAISLYKKAIQINANHPDAYTNLGGLYKDLGNIDQALDSTLKSLELQPNNPIALLNLGGIYKDLGNIDQALDSTLKSLELQPNNPIALLNLGGIYKDLGNIDQALDSTLKSLELQPGNPIALLNLGSIYQDLGNLDQALDSALKSLELKPDNPDALLNLGGIYQDLGNPDQALVSILKSLELKPDNPHALLNLGMTYETLNKLDSALESYTKSADLIAQNSKEGSLISLIGASTMLLQMNRIQDANEALLSAYSTALSKEVAPKQGSIKAKKNSIAYLSYLRKLIPTIPRIEATLDPQILHLGESHCLAFTNQTIELKGVRCTIRPSLVKGAKAFHLSEESKANQQKIGFERRLQQNLDDFKYIFLSFGEIDCREDEGILLYSRKSGKAIQDVSRATATNYFKWTSNALAKYQDKLVYFGTPAPFRIDPGRGESLENSEQRLLAITIFNAALALHCQQSEVMFANVYELTAGKEGYNNSEWMLDARHLKPKALNELVKAL